jgi:hypothetical protein
VGLELFSPMAETKVAAYELVTKKSDEFDLLLNLAAGGFTHLGLLGARAHRLVGRAGN